MSSHESFRRAFASATPVPVRRLIRGNLNYWLRIGRWIIILWQIRGVSWKDQWNLIVSASAAPLVSILHPTRWQDPLLFFDTFVRVRGVGIFQLRKRSDDLWHVLPWRERAIFSRIRALLRPGDIFIDAGANIGIYSVLAARLVGAEGRVIAIEMIPDTAEQLAGNVALNQLANVDIVREAVSDESGRTLTATIKPGKLGQATIVQQKSSQVECSHVSVQTTTLDQLTKNVSEVRLIKLDLEGAELRAISGARSALSKTAHLIYENWNHREGEVDPIRAALLPLGFRVETLDANNCLARKVI